MQLDYLIACNDDYKCLTQLANRDEENNFSKSTKGMDGMMQPKRLHVYTLTCPPKKRGTM